MANHRWAQKQAFSMVPETCPQVDAALGVAAEAIKEQTGKLRDALIEAIERAEDAEDRANALEERVRELESQLEAVST